MKGDQNDRQPSYFRWFMDGGERGGMTCELLLAANSSRAVASRIGAQSQSLLPSSAPQATTILRMPRALWWGHRDHRFVRAEGC